MKDPAMILRRALVHVLNLMHIKQDLREDSDDWRSLSQLICENKCLEEYTELECHKVNNSLALSLKNSIVTIDA